MREDLLRALEVRGEGTVETIVIALVLDQAGARQVVETLGARRPETARERLEQSQQFGDRRRYAGALQQQEEPNEHSGD